MPRVARTNFVLQQLGPMSVEGRFASKYERAMGAGHRYFKFSVEGVRGEETVVIPTPLVLMATEQVIEMTQEEYDQYQEQKEEREAEMAQKLAEASEKPEPLLSAVPGSSQDANEGGEEGAEQGPQKTSGFIQEV